MEKNDKGTIKENNSIKQEQIQDLLFSDKIGWKDIILDLINTNRLNPWDIDILFLSDSYIKKINELKELNFFISSKVLLAASLLLKIKTEILLNNYIKSIDDILFKKQEKIKIKKQEFNEDIPEIFSRTPLPRFRKISLNELIESLNKAINTENRRIKKEIINKESFEKISFSLPKKRINVKDRIKEIYNSLLNHFKKNKNNKILFNSFIKSKKKVLDYFVPLLYLDKENKILLEQEESFGEISILINKELRE